MSHAKAKPAPAPIPAVDLQAQYRRLKPAIDRRIQRVLEHGRFVLGPEVAEFEEALARYAGARHCVGVSSGTDALMIAMMAERIGRGDAVFMPAYSFRATAEVPVRLGATPVFVDIEPGTLNIDAGDLERRIELVKREGRLNPRAIVAVDLFGLPAAYEALAPVAERSGLSLLADAAQSFGARLGNRQVGSLAPTTAVSFYPSKPLGGYGDGGALLTDDAERAAKFRALRQHGAGPDRIEVLAIGINGRLDTLQAAVLLAKLEAFGDELRQRQRVADAYDRHFTGRIETQSRPKGRASALAQYAILIEDRDRVKATLAADGIGSAIYYHRPLHLEPPLLRFGPGPGALPVAEATAKRNLCLPMHADLDDSQIDRVAEAVLAAVKP
ncbi:MAG: DegT/DnrJ/EryC1/StrS family aminotransferase [Proteobacteria bacterium]|nr:DegT/DnrJ/EryC1/StrS family aminotransferase [Pseudomonadota bacterium]MBI3499320.1 DegT/DnrJ/EryC1/StrS family aminotransferase [Pseudomonadota bacterium]